jgi:hypothetical protein
VSEVLDVPVLARVSARPGAARAVDAGILATRHPRRIRTTVTGRGLADPIPVRIKTDSFVPRLVLGTDDDRTLGVVVSHMRLGHPFGHLRLENVVGTAEFDRQVSEALETYQVIAANSEYTAEWVERVWRRAATVLSPPVLMRASGTKRQIILAVGRFFRATAGNEEAARNWCRVPDRASVALQGWELPWRAAANPTARVRRGRACAAVGLPVKFHVNAPGDDVAELFSPRLRLFWHGSGIGEDIERAPNRLEHFGITVVEAMSAGAVPLVCEYGGSASHRARAPLPGRTRPSRSSRTARSSSFAHPPSSIGSLRPRLRARAVRVRPLRRAHLRGRDTDGRALHREGLNVGRNGLRYPITEALGYSDRFVLRTRTLAPIHCPVCVA